MRLMPFKRDHKLVSIYFMVKTCSSFLFSAGLSSAGFIPGRRISLVWKSNGNKVPQRR